MGAFLPRDDVMQNEQPGDYGDRFARRAPGRSRAFRDASRHSGRVKWLRRLILGGAALTTIGVVGYSWLRPQDAGNVDFSLESFGVSSDKVTMEHPKMTGVRRDGRPYEVIAESGVQNPRDPSRTTLTRLDARLHMGDNGVTRILGDTGVYDSNKQTLDLEGHVHVKGEGYDLALRSATMDFRTNAMTSATPVRLDMDSGWIQSDAMNMSDNGERLTFTGNVQSQFRQEPEDTAVQLRKDD